MSNQSERTAGEVRIHKQRPTDVLARRVRELRKRQGMSAQKLADRCDELGMPSLNRAVISTIENGRRQDVSLEETLVLALALNTAPVHLFVPPADEWMQVGRDSVGSGPVREWVRGRHPLPSVENKRFYYVEVPDQEWEPPQRNPQEDLRALRRGFREGWLSRYGVTNYETGERIEGGPEGERRFNVDDEDGE